MLPLFPDWQPGLPAPAAEVAPNPVTVDLITKPKGHLSLLSPPSAALQGPMRALLPALGVPAPPGFTMTFGVTLSFSPPVR